MTDGREKELYANEYYRVFDRMCTADGVDKAARAEDRALDEISEVLSWLHCSLEELYLKCQTNKKLLSKAANEYLERHFVKLFERMK